MKMANYVINLTWDHPAPVNSDLIKIFKYNGTAVIAWNHWNVPLFITGD